MTSRRSSGSIPVESAVDPTRSQNITVKLATLRVRPPQRSRPSQAKPAQRPASRAWPQGRSASQRAVRPPTVPAALWARVGPRARRAPRQEARHRGRPDMQRANQLAPDVVKGVVVELR
jgi:hypothetical protein